MVHRDPDPIDDVDPDPLDEDDAALDEIVGPGYPPVPDDQPGDLSFPLVDSPASLDAWLQVSRLMSQLEEAFTWLSEIESGLRETPPSKPRIRRGSRQLIRCFDAVAWSMPSIAAQVAAALTSGSSDNYDKYIAKWWTRMQSRQKARRVRWSR